MIKQIKKDLTVSPIVLKGYQDFVKPVEFEIFQESPNYFYLPRYYGIDKFGPPSKINLPTGVPINLKFAFNLLPHQITSHQKTLQTLREHGGGVLQLPCGLGKCLAKGTPILMFDGTIKPVEEIRVGDQVMGDDSTPRHVLSLAQGQEQMYQIKPNKGEPWGCNQSHILSLKSPSNQIIDIALSDYLQLPEPKSLKLYKVPVIFPSKPIQVDPYWIGWWCGRNGVEIPHVYKCNSRTVQSKVLSGLIGGNSFPHSHHHSESFINDVVFLSHSLGLVVDRRLDQCQIIGDHLLINLSEDLMTDFMVESIGMGDYYGFMIDGNGRFLLGDFTVTHNTAIAIKIAIDLGGKTLVVVNKECLMDQWVESISKFTNREARIGYIQQDKVDVVDKDFVVAMIHSICKKDYPKAIFNDFSLTIIDEAHHIGSEMFSKALPKIANKYMLGLSATPNRKDGLSHVFYKYLGNVCHSERRQGKNQVFVKKLKLTSNSPMYETLYMSNGTKNTSAMVTNLAKYDVRTALIIEIIRLLMTEDRKILVLSARREHLETIYDLLGKALIKNIRGQAITFGYYYGNQGDNKQKHRQMLQQSVKCDIVLGTIAIACLSDQTIYTNYLTGEELTLAQIADDYWQSKLPVVSFDQLSGQFELDRAINIGYTAPKQCYRMVHDLGQIVASYDHQFYTQRGWVPLGQMTTDDHLISARRITIQSIDIPELSVDDCWLIGSQTYTVPLPTRLMLLPDEKIIYLLEGMFKMGRFITTSHQLKNQILFLLKRLGIQPIFDQMSIMIDPNQLQMPMDEGLHYHLVRIQTIEELDNSEPIKLCDLTIAKNHNFLIGGILVHNSEGLDIPDLNTEILATPSTDVEQAVGRILRKYHDKVNPLIIDLVDSFGSFINQARVRSKFYKDENYEIHDMKLPWVMRSKIYNHFYQRSKIICSIHQGRNSAPLSPPPPAMEGRGVSLNHLANVCWMMMKLNHM